MRICTAILSGLYRTAELGRESGREYLLLLRFNVTIRRECSTKEGTMSLAFFKNKRFYNFVIVPFVILLSGIIRTVCVEVFTLPYDFAPGGSTGIAAMVEYKTGFSAAWTTLIVNAPLLILAFFLISKDFAIKTGAAIGVASAGMLVFEKLDLKVYENGEPVLAALPAGCLGGVALAMMLKINGSTGGTDIVAMFIQKKFSATNVAWFIYMLDAIVVFVSAFIYENGLTPVLMSLVEMFCLASMSDVITSGLKTALKFEIITRQPEEISKELIEKLGRGVTCIDVTGMYSHDDKFLIVCVIRKRQLTEFNKILKKYPDTFAYITSASEVVGLGFSR